MQKRKLIPLALCLMLLAGCSGTPVSPDTGKLSVVCTVFPQYDWAREIIGDTEDVNLTLLVDNGTDFHSYQPGTDDMVTIASCDVLVYIGGESDSWIEDSLANSVNPDMQRVNLTEILGDSLLEEACTVEGDHHDHEHDHEGKGHTYDEHVWLSLKNAELFSGAVTDALCKADEANADIYRDNAESYISKIRSMDEEFESVIGSADRNVLLFADRFPFAYLMEDYDLEYYAAFPGCSAETDASFETVIELAAQADANELPCVLTIDGSDSSIADAVISNTANKNQKILALDSMQSVSREDIEGGATYLSLMKNNLDILTEALN